MGAQRVVLGAVLLLCYAGSILAMREKNLNYPVLCARLQPLEELEIAQLSGEWLTVEALLLRDGFPSAEQSRRRVCVRTTVFEASDVGLSMSAEVHAGRARRRTGRTKFLVENPLQPGRWAMQSRLPTSLSSEFLVLAAVPSKYLVLAFCQPIPEDAVEEEGDRPALWVKILARPEGSGGAPRLAMSKHEVTSLREHVARMLRVPHLESVHFDTSCA